MGTPSVTCGHCGRVAPDELTRVGGETLCRDCARTHAVSRRTVADGIPESELALRRIWRERKADRGGRWQ